MSRNHLTDLGNGLVWKTGNIVLYDFLRGRLIFFINERRLLVRFRQEVLCAEAGSGMEIGLGLGLVSKEAFCTFFRSIPSYVTLEPHIFIQYLAASIVPFLTREYHDNRGTVAHISSGARRFRSSMCTSPKPDFDKICRLNPVAYSQVYGSQYTRSKTRMRVLIL